MATSPIHAGSPVTPPCASLPDDIILNIVARLPAEAVVRCRCLSRAWATTLSSDDFVYRYFNLGNPRHSPSVFFLPYSFHDGQYRPSKSSSAPLGVPRATTNGNTLYSAGAVLRLVTVQCRDLVILQDSDTEINYLCNPSTGQMATLPKGHREGEKNQHHASLGLAYDVHTKRHLVVRIYYEGRDLEGLPTSAGCELHVVNSTRPWRLIREKPPAWVRYYKPSVFARGQVYWLAYGRVNMSNNKLVEMAIVSFSLDDHRFRTVAPPLGMESESLSKHELTELDGYLCLFSYKVSHSSHFDIWMLLSKYGASGWNLRCRIDMSQVSPDIADRFVRCWLYPLAIINNGRRILLLQPHAAFDEKYSQLCTYDLVTGDVEDVFSGKNIVYDHMMCKVDDAVYEENIISFGRG